MRQFVSRAGEKLDHALNLFELNVTGWICADFGCNTGGFTDCLLKRDAAKVYAIDTGYGALDWSLRKDPRVVVMERTNAMHVTLPERVDLVTIDVAWTKQKNILPAAKRVLKPTGIVVSLIKPHYESDAKLLVKGILPGDDVGPVVESVKQAIRSLGYEVIQTVPSPILGAGGNAEVVSLLRIAQMRNA